MSGAARIAAFLALLTLVGGGAALAGAAIDPTTPTDEPRAAHGAMSGHGAMTTGDATAGGDDAHGGHDADAVPQGLQAAADGFRLELARTRYARPGEAPIAFRILGPDGDAVRAFDVEHAKRLHLIAVRRDMTGFQHLHPAMDADGTWRASTRLAAAGAYRVFADFSHDGTRRTLAVDVQVGGRYAPRALPAPTRTARTADGLRVTLDAAPARAGREDELTFAVHDGARDVTDRLGTYLGAKGHLVALREGDLAYLHVHPDGDRLAFMGSYPSAGRYRLWVQFRYRGKVETAAFTQEVAR